MLLVLMMLDQRGEGGATRSRYEEVLKNLADRKQVRVFPEGSVTYFAAADAS